MLRRIYRSVMFRLLKTVALNRIAISEATVFLTFDDGPDPEITMSILDILDDYDAKATFFVVAGNIENNTGLRDLITDRGHKIANHSYSHPDGLYTSRAAYLEDVLKGSDITGSSIFRPPWGTLTPGQYSGLVRKFQIVLWNISSDDCRPGTNWEAHCNKMVSNSEPGSIILFHSSSKHEAETMKILPLYLEEMRRLNFRFSALPL
jgi:peptidoglycan/xylan/chitin deacetylase (PgdA/CDA1 family)